MKTLWKLLVCRKPLCLLLCCCMLMSNETAFANSATIPWQRQNRFCDSLKIVLKTQTLTDKQKMDIYHNITSTYSSFAIDSIVVYGTMGIALAQKLNDYETLCGLYLHVGTAYCFKANYDTALMYYDRMKELGEKYGIKNAEADAVQFTAFTYKKQGKYNTAIDYYLKSLELDEENANYDRSIVALLNLCEINRRLGNTEIAIQYLKQAEEKSDILKRPLERRTAIYNEYAYNYIEQGNWNEALRYALKADSLNPYGGIIIKCYTKSLLATIYLHRNDYDRALQYAQECYRQADLLKDKNLYANAGKILSDVYLAKKQYSQAESEAFKVWLADSTNIDESLAVVKNIAMANIYLHNTEKAAYYLTRYAELNEMYSKKSFQNTISDLSIKYETEKKEIRIAALEDEKKFYAILGTAGITILLLALGLLFFRHRLNIHKRKLLEQQSELSEQKIKQLEQEKQLIASQAIIDGETAERTRLARDLHDGLGGMLSVVKLNLKDMNGYSVIENTDVSNFSRAVEMLDLSIAELRRVSHNIMPDLSGGLEMPLEDFCRSIPEAKFRFFGNDSHLDNRLKITIYRCAHELINNAIKHARATSINVQLMVEGNLISLSVQDDGIGFDPSKVKKGSGLENIQARAAMFNGTVNIFSSPEKGGTEINVEIELP